MEQQPSRQPVKRSPLALAFNVFVILLILGAAGQAFQVRGLNNRVVELESQLTAQDNPSANDRNNNGWNTVVKSGKGGFEVTFPDGWGPITNDLNGDFMIMLGTTQPTVVTGSKVVVNETHGFGTDSPSLFSIWLSNKGERVPPQGTGEEFSFSNRKETEPITGTKYIYIHPKDELEGIGYLRLQGDRSYEYIVPVGDKELHVFYNVYGSDPRNLIETVDKIVDTIKLGAISSANR